MERRSFLASMLAAAAAPAFVRGGVLMPIKPVIWTPPTLAEMLGATGVIRIMTEGGMLLASVPNNWRGAGDKQASYDGIGTVIGTGTAARFEMLNSRGEVVMKGKSGGPGSGAGFILDNAALSMGCSLQVAGAISTSG